MDSSLTIRARLVLACIVLAAATLVGSLYRIQITEGETYAARADRQYRPSALLFDRGSIFLTAKDGSHPTAATLNTTYEISMTPNLVTDPEAVYEVLSHYMDLDREDFLRRAARQESKYELIAKKVEPDIAESIRTLKIGGISVTRESRRSYPGGSLATHVIGIIGEGDDGTLQGKYGLERFYEDVLSRSGARGSRSLFAQIFTGAYDASAEQGVRGDVVSSIEPTVQAYLEKALLATSDKWKPEQIGGIIIDPRDGSILAAAAFPTYDPNDLSKIPSASILSNPLVESAYEMGSIIKPLTVAIGLDSGAVTSGWTYDDTGTMTLDGKRISNYDGRARGVVGLQEVLSQSLNVGVAHISLKVGKSEFANYLRTLGFGTKTGVDLPYESAGLVGNLSTGRDIEIATAAYGQGIAITPMATARGLSTLANGGKLVTPRFATEIQYLDGTKEPVSRGETVQVLKPESVLQTTRMLVKVVDDALGNGAYKLDKYSVAAKTGTAQIADLRNGGYLPDQYLHSFFGYFPAYDAKFLIFLYQKHPKGAQYASETLSEPFHDLTKFLISYYNVPPDR